MRTFQQFVEATESDVRAMGGSQAQIDALKARQAKRGYGFESNDKRNASAPSKTQTNRPNTPTVTRPSQPTTTTNKDSVKTATPGTGMPSSRSSSAPKPQSRGGALATTGSSSPATTPKPKSSALATTPKPKSSALATTPKPKSRALATTPKQTTSITKQPKTSSAITKSRPEPAGKLARPDEKQAGAQPGTSRRPASPPQKPKKQPINYRKHVDSAVKTAGKVGKYASGLAKSTRGKVGDSKASQVQGSSEIIRGSRS